MNKNKLLVGTLALVLIAGIVTPAFASGDITNKPEDAVSKGNTDILAPSLADPEDIVFENGDPVPDGIGYFIDSNLPIDNFVLVEDTAITDVHFIIALDDDPTPFEGPFEYFVFGDEGGVPDGDNLIASGIGVDVETEFLGLGEVILIPRYAIWFDFEEPIPLEGGETYWIGLHAGEEFVFLAQRPVWEFSSEKDDGLFVAIDGNLDDLVGPVTPGSWFQITSKGDVVAGEILPTDTTALFLAGLSQSAVWMIPPLAGIAGAGIVIRNKLHRD